MNLTIRPCAVLWWAFYQFALLLALGFAVAFYALYHRYRTLRRRHDDLLREKEVMFGFVHDVAEVFAESDTVDLNALLQRVLYYALRTTRASAGAIYLLDPDDRQLQARAVAGIFPPLAEWVDIDLDSAPSRAQYIEQLVRSQTVRRGVGLIGETADYGGPVIIADAERDPRVPHYDADILRVRSLLAVPMRYRRRIMGVLVVVNPVDGRPFTESDLGRLQALADQASVSTHYTLLHKDLDAKRRIDHDLSIARQIQLALLPRRMPSIPNLELAAFNVPALEIGGDYYDLIRIDPTRWGIAIADVSGKGVGGALLMSVCRSVLRAHAPGCPYPAEVLRRSNRIIREDLYEDMFITAAYLVIDTSTGELRVARAGHEPPIIRRAADGSLAQIECDGLAIGLGGPDLFDETLNEVSVALCPGDLIVLYTDGITEAQNEQGEEWGLERLIATLRQAPLAEAGTVLNHLRMSLMSFVGQMTPYDDMTMVLARWLGPPSLDQPATSGDHAMPLPSEPAPAGSAIR